MVGFQIGEGQGLHLRRAPASTVFWADPTHLRLPLIPDPHVQGNRFVGSNIKNRGNSSPVTIGLL